MCYVIEEYKLNYNVKMYLKDDRKLQDYSYIVKGTQTWMNHVIEVANWHFDFTADIIYYYFIYFTIK